MLAAALTGAGIVMLLVVVSGAAVLSIAQDYRTSMIEAYVWFMPLVLGLLARFYGLWSGGR